MRKVNVFNLLKIQWFVMPAVWDFPIHTLFVLWPC